MSLKHKVTINVTKPGGDRNPVIESSKKTVRSKMLEFIAASTHYPVLSTAQNVAKYTEGFIGTIEDAGPLSGDASAALKKRVPTAHPQPSMKRF
jgi:hypothetical protein